MRIDISPIILSSLTNYHTRNEINTKLYGNIKEEDEGVL